MKILQLVTKRQYRGAEVFAANLSSELIEFGHEIIFAGLYQHDSDILEVENALNIDLCTKKTGNFSFYLVKNLVALIKKEKPDVVQCNGSDTLKYMVVASFFTPKTPITYRNISTISEWIDSPIKLKVYKYLFKRVAHVTSVGSESIQDLINTLGYPEGQTSVIRRGIPIKEIKTSQIDHSLRDELKLKDKDKIVMHIGNFSPEKNHEFLLDIFSRIKKENSGIKLVCVGDGINFSSIQHQIKKQSLEHTVFLLGFRKDIPELLSQADCFILASKIEGVPGVILEAASQRVPSVATNVGGVPEVLINGKTGFIIDNFDKKEFKERLISLVSNSEINKEMGENAFRLVQNEFNPLRNARKFEVLYTRLANKRLEKEKLRILQIIQKKQLRGAEVFASQLGNHLQSSGHIVKIISIYDGTAHLPFDGKIESLNRNKRHRSFDPNGWRKLNEIVKSFQPDIIQANASDTLKYAVLSKLFFRWKAPLVYRNASTSSFYIKNKLTKNVNAFLLKKIDLIISVSQASLKDLNILFPFTKNKSLVIPVGVEETLDLDKKKIKNPFKNKEKFNLLHIGSFTREKNHIGLIKIFNKTVAKNNNFHLSLIGEGPLIPNIKKLVSDLELSENVDFLGEIENPRDYLIFSDTFLLPSLVEGLPGVILEAMYYKTPVVAYNVGGVSEVLSNNLTGKLIKFDDEKGFSDAVIELKRNKELMVSIVQNAYALICENFLNTDIKEDFLTSYMELERGENPLNLRPEHH
ncbi:glycosyltransferase [Salinimicrobium sp. MT39]|uniref:Glycosyltransferase n=1 Tax=Salinimicrobium profundisediminis TaxID=2994553 RepID=A0A9X3I1G4_9FLAO|nr:glycosyltransferase [Salinimicrobium profundisediminis]MCX2837907.1 glycosyltransferase [Salinimicrobium profundisediminis]